jgi:vanillate O-demethylase monooxygenase subunit
VRSYPIVERHRLVWIWIGDPALADPAQVPDLRWNDAPGWAFAGDMLPMACDYRLVIDNLLDLTHETYIHPTTLGHDLIPGTPIETNWDAESVTVSRLIPDHRPAPFWAKMIERTHGWSGRCDRWQIMKFVPPCNVVLDVGVAEVGTDAFEGNRSRGITGRQLNSLTPATATTCWYFWSLARDFALDDEALTRELQTTVRHIFAEDQTIIEAQQRSMLENPGARTININLDAASIRMRQMIEARSANGRTQAA